MKRELTREIPQYTDEGQQQNRRLQQADREIGGEFGEVARVFVHALIRVDADRSRVREARRAAGQHPMVDQILDQALAQLDLRHFSEIALHDVECEQRAGNESENAELYQKLREVAPR